MSEFLVELGFLILLAIACGVISGIVGGGKSDGSDWFDGGF